MKEIWKPVIGYENYYEVSSFGHVRNSANFKLFKQFAGRIKFKRIRRKYYVVKLQKNKTEKQYFIHRLVAISFIPNPERKPQVNHKDGNKLNNCVSNLEWCTPKENCQHAYRTGLNVALKGEGNSQSKITSEIALKIFNDIDTHVKIAAKYGLYPATVGVIKKGGAWSHITGKKYERRRFVPETIIELRKDALIMNKKQLREKYKTNAQHINQILSRTIWKNI